MLQNGETSTNVHAELRTLELPLAICTKILVLIAYVEAELRTCEEEHVGNTTQADAVAHVDRNVDSLCLQSLLCGQYVLVFVNIYCEFCLTLVLESRSVDAKTYERKCELHSRTDEEACTVVGVEHL